MFKKVRPYMGGYIKYTRAAVTVMLIGIIASVVPYFFVYRIIEPLLSGKHLSLNYYALHIGGVALCEIVYSLLYVLGLKFSHISAYNTLKNIRISLQKKLERQPLGTIQEMGNGKIKKLFTDDIEQIELLLAHAIPEGISNLAVALVVLFSMFAVDWRLALLSLCSLAWVFTSGGRVRSVFPVLSPDVEYHPVSLGRHAAEGHVRGAEDIPAARLAVVDTQTDSSLRGLPRAAVLTVVTVRTHVPRSR